MDLIATGCQRPRMKTSESRPEKPNPLATKLVATAVVIIALAACGGSSRSIARSSASQAPPFYQSLASVLIDDTGVGSSVGSSAGRVRDPPTLPKSSSTTSESDGVPAATDMMEIAPKSRWNVVPPDPTTVVATAGAPGSGSVSVSWSEKWPGTGRIQDYLVVGGGRVDWAMKWSYQYWLHTWPEPNSAFGPGSQTALTIHWAVSRCRRRRWEPCTRGPRWARRSISTTEGG